MSLLDELKQQANAKQETDDSLKQRQDEIFYEETILPKMHRLLNYLNELVTHLKAVDPDVRHSYQIPGIGLVENLRQQDYVVNADSSDQTRFIRLKFECSAGQEHTYSVKPKSAADETREFFDAQHMRYSEWPIRDPFEGIVGINFQLTIKLQVNFIFEADLLQGGIRMTTTNFSDAGAERTLIQPHRIDEQWLDNLGNYLLRRHQKLYTLEIEEEEKEQIRKQLEAQKRARQIELEQAIQREQEELEEKRRNSFLGRLRGLAKKTQGDAS